MSTLKEAVDEFMTLDRIAVTGVSRSGKEAANAINKKMKGAGYTVFPTNPNADEVEGDSCFPDLKSIPEGVNGVVIATHPKDALDIVKECFQLVNDIKVIPGGCPMMFVEKVDVGHKCMRWFLGVTGSLPKKYKIRFAGTLRRRMSCSGGSQSSPKKPGFSKNPVSSLFALDICYPYNAFK